MSDMVFSFRINAQVFFTEVSKRNDDAELSKWVRGFASALITNIGNDDFSSKIIEEAQIFYKKKSDAGLASANSKKEKMAAQAGGDFNTVEAVLPTQPQHCWSSDTNTASTNSNSNSSSNSSYIKTLKEEKTPLRDRTFYEEIINDLSSKADYEFRPDTNTIGMIDALISQGHSQDDFFQVHTNMISNWEDDDKMRKWIRPSTLYKPDKFQEYLNTRPKPKKPVMEEWR